MIYDLMKHHFDYHQYPGVNYEIQKSDKKSVDDLGYQENRIELVKDLSENLEEFNIKLAASFARIRIENQARGTTLKEQTVNILSPEVREKEDLAVEIPKTFRIDTSKISMQRLESELKKNGIVFQSSPTIFDLE